MSRTEMPVRGRFEGGKTTSGGNSYTVRWSMDHRQLIARLLSDVSSARASIAASYLRMWPKDTVVPTEANDTLGEPEAEPERPGSPDEGV